MSYPIEFVPFPDTRVRLKKKDADAYLSWYLANRERRIRKLADFLSVTADDLDHSTLVELMVKAGLWLSSNARLVNISPESVPSSYGIADSSMFLDLRGTTISPETFLFCFDMSLAFCSILTPLLPDAKLEVWTKNRRDVDYGQVVITGTGFIDVDPFRKCRTMAYKALDGTEMEHEVRTMIEFHSNLPENERRALEDYHRALAEMKTRHKSRS